MILIDWCWHWGKQLYIWAANAPFLSLTDRASWIAYTDGWSPPTTLSGHSIANTGRIGEITDSPKKSHLVTHKMMSNASIYYKWHLLIPFIICVWYGGVYCFNHAKNESFNFHHRSDWRRGSIRGKIDFMMENKVNLGHEYAFTKRIGKAQLTNRGPDRR